MLDEDSDEGHGLSRQLVLVEAVGKCKQSAHLSQRQTLRVQPGKEGAQVVINLVCIGEAVRACQTQGGTGPA